MASSRSNRERGLPLQFLAPTRKRFRLPSPQVPRRGAGGAAKALPDSPTTGTKERRGYSSGSGDCSSSPSESSFVLRVKPLERSLLRTKPQRPNNSLSSPKSGCEAMPSRKVRRTSCNSAMLRSRTIRRPSCALSPTTTSSLAATVFLWTGRILANEVRPKSTSGASASRACIARIAFFRILFRFK